MTISDAIRIPNSNLLEASCMEMEGVVYLRESSIAKIAEENRISDKDALCNAILEEYGYNPEYHKYMIIKDIQSGIINEHTYIAPIGDDSLLEMMEFAESCIDMYVIERRLNEAEYVEMRPNENLTKIMYQKVGLFYERLDAVIRRVNYNEPKEIKRRIDKCDRAIKSLERELEQVKQYKEDPRGDKRDLHQMNCAVLIKALINLGKDIAEVLVGNVVNDIANAISVSVEWKKLIGIKHKDPVKATIKRSIDAAVGLIDKVYIKPQDYKTQLENYIKSINKTKAFLEKELEKSERKANAKNDKETQKQQVKESVRYNQNSIQSIMHETSMHQEGGNNDEF